VFLFFFIRKPNWRQSFSPKNNWIRKVFFGWGRMCEWYFSCEVSYETTFAKKCIEFSIKNAEKTITKSFSFV